MEFLFELLLEFLLEIVFEILAELGLHGIAEVFHRRRERNPIIAFIGYALLGVAAGGVSLLLFPNPLLHSTKFHGIGLIAIPLLAGLVMSGMGALRRQRGKDVIRLDSFSYGFIFAFGMVVIRYFFAG